MRTVEEIRTRKALVDQLQRCIVEAIEPGNYVVLGKIVRLDPKGNLSLEGAATVVSQTKETL